MGNKQSKKTVSDEDMKFLMSKVEDKSLGVESTFYRLNFTDSGHTKSMIQVVLCFTSIEMRDLIRQGSYS